MTPETAHSIPRQTNGRGAEPGWQAEWPTRLQSQLRRTFRRWVYAGMGAALGVTLVWVLQAEALEEVWRTEQALDTWRAQVVERPQARPSGTPAVARLSTEQATQMLDHLPGQSAQARLWPALQQVFARRHVQLLSLRPVQERLAAPLPSQAMAWRLQARFGDWAQAWADMNEGVPVWTIDRMRISPRTPPQAVPEVEIDVVLRVWLRQDPEGPLAWSGRAGPQSASVPHAAAVFVGDNPLQAHALAVSAQAAADAAKPLVAGPSDSPDPSDWPWARVRLTGIWQQSPTRQAILEFGPHWAWARAGQRISLEGHVLESIGDQSVSVRSGQGVVKELNFAKVPR